MTELGTVEMPDSARMVKFPASPKAIGPGPRAMTLVEIACK